jgi:hypothetical protein
MRDEEVDLSFAELVPGRPYTALLEERAADESRKLAELLARREGLELPSLRFEACSLV